VPKFQALFLVLKSDPERSASLVARAAAVHAPPGCLYLRKMPWKTVIFRRSALALYCIGTSYQRTAPCFVHEQMFTGLVVHYSVLEPMAW